LAVALPPAPEEDGFMPSAGVLVPYPAGTAEDCKEITIISGKGGTGKTSVVGSLAHLASSAILADNDVDAADLHLLLQPTIREEHDFVGGTKAYIDAARCTGCGRCAEACHFAAIRNDGPANNAVDTTCRIETLACEGCGLCPLVCPVDAIRSEQKITGRWFVSGTDCGPMAHARLGLAEENSGRLVTQVRKRAGELAHELKKELILGDGPPGTGCPVIASVSGIDLAVVVTEPTVSGVHDLERVMKLADHFGVPTAVIINKADLNAEQARRIDAAAAEHGSEVIGRIPFDEEVNNALMAGKTVIEYGRGAAAAALRQVWERLQKRLRGEEP
jgi:MinD superfamily P-loop ATPase